MKLLANNNKLCASGVYSKVTFIRRRRFPAGA